MPKRFGITKTAPLSMRTTPELREKIESAAKKSGRSLVQEVEYRVIQSFQVESIDRAVFAAVSKHIAVLRYLDAADRGIQPE